MSTALEAAVSGASEADVAAALIECVVREGGAVNDGLARVRPNVVMLAIVACAAAYARRSELKGGDS